MSNDSTTHNISPCEAVNCYSNLTERIAVKVGDKGSIFLFLCKDCKRKFAINDDFVEKGTGAAASTAAPEAREILVDMQGRTICNIPPGATTSGSPSEEESRDHGSNTVAVVEPLDLRKRNKTTTHNRRKRTICQEQIQNNEPIGVVNKATQLTETSTIPSPSFGQGTNKSEENKSVLFEFSLGYKICVILYIRITR